MTVLFAGLWGVRGVHKQRATYDWNDKTPVAPQAKYDAWVASLNPSRHNPNPKMLRRVTLAVRSGTSVAEACRCCGLSPSTYHRIPDELK